MFIQIVESVQEINRERREQLEWGYFPSERKGQEGGTNSWIMNFQFYLIKYFIFTALFHVEVNIMCVF